MGIDNHHLDHDYIFLKITDRNDNDREIVMKKNEGRGDHLYNYIGDLEDCGDSWQLHTHADDIIVVGRWWSQKRIGCINGEVGWVCRNNDFITHRLGVTLFAPLNLMIDTAFEVIGDPSIDEKIKGLTNDEVTAFIAGPPYPTVSQKLQRIFFGEVRDETAPEETAADEGTDDDNSDSDYSSSSSSSSSGDYDYSYSSSNTSNATSNSPDNSGGFIAGFWIIMFIIWLFFLLFGRAIGWIEDPPARTDKHDSGYSVGTEGGVDWSNGNLGVDDPPLPPPSNQGGAETDTPQKTEMKQTPYPWVKLPQSPQPAERTPSPPPLVTPQTKSENTFDRLLNEEERVLTETEESLIRQELDRRKRNPASPEQARRAEAAGRDSLGHSPYER